MFLEHCILCMCQEKLHQDFFVTFVVWHNLTIKIN